MAISSRLGRNVRTLRDARGFTQQQMSKLAGLPRATWAHVESGSGNPTLAVLHAVAGALQVPIEELIAAPRAEARHYERGSLPQRRQGSATVRKLLPDPVPGMEIERIELPADGRMVGVPHMPGTREYLTCETGRLVVVVAGERYALGVGDVVVFRGDQRHSYLNAGEGVAVGYSVVLLGPV